MFFVLILVSVALIYHFRVGSIRLCPSVTPSLQNTEIHVVKMGIRIRFDKDRRLLDVQDLRNHVVLRGRLGVNIHKFEVGLQPGPVLICSLQLPYDCTDDKHLDKTLCLEWRQVARLRIQYRRLGRTGNCYSVQWTSLDAHTDPRDCFELREAHWFGGGQLRAQPWPLERGSVSNTPYLSSTSGQWPWGSVLERYWLSSRGVAIVGDDVSPLHVSLNERDSRSNRTDGALCLAATYKDLAFRPPATQQPPVLNYSICVDSDVTTTHRLMLKELTTPPGSVPTTQVFAKPVWSTSHLGGAMNQSSVEAHARDLAQHGHGGTFVIGRGWQKQEGDFAFNIHKFPSPERLLSVVTDLGFDVVLSLSPFVSIRSPAFIRASERHLLVRDAGGRVPGLLRPRDVTPRGFCAVVDMESRGATWFAQKLQALRRLFPKVTSFSFEAGEVSELPAHATFSTNYSSRAMFTTAYATAVHAALREAPGAPHMRVARRTQHLPLIVRAHGSHSSWSGLRRVIPLTLTLGLLGYPFVLSDVVGGRGAASKELYIRWLQLTTFLPSQQFSAPPHAFDAEVQQVARQCAQLRRKHVLPVLAALLRLAASDLTPVVRPLWWSSPRDPAALRADDAFLLGDSLLVAPVVEEGATERDVYLPRGRWLPAPFLNSAEVVGPRWLRNVFVPLNQVAFFEKLS